MFLNFLKLYKMLLIFVFTITNVLGGYSTDSYARLPARQALRPPAYINSNIAVRNSSAGEDLDKAEVLYFQNNLKSMAEATDILRDYLYSTDEYIKSRVKSMVNNEKRKGIFVICYLGKTEHCDAPSALSPGKIPSKRLFDDMVKSGLIKPIVIVNFKKISYRIEEAYMDEMKRISQYYNGNVTFILKVEEPTEFQADFPGAIEALYQAKKIMGEDAFNKSLIIQIPDGGLKSRLGPVSLRYNKQGLVPFHRNTSYLREVMIRSGRLVMQLAKKNNGGYSFGHHIICASDTIINPESFTLDKSSTVNVQIGAVSKQLKDVIDKVEDGKVVDEAIVLLSGRKIVSRLEEIPAHLRPMLLSADKNFSLSRLYYMLTWDKKSLSDYLELAYATKMDNGEPIAHALINMHLEFSKSTFYSESEWRRMYDAKSMSKKEITFEDWIKIRKLAVTVFGEYGAKTNIAVGKATDEGRLNEIINRFRNRKLFPVINIREKDPPPIIKKDSGIMLGNAEEAKLDNVVIKGKGTIIFGGPNVYLTNVLIELNDDERLYIPDGWTIIDSYIGKNSFEKGGGIIIGAILFEDNIQQPLTGKVFKTGTCNSVICMKEDEPLFISANLNNPTQIEVSEGDWTFTSLKDNIDASKNRGAIFVLRDRIYFEFKKRQPIFPIYENSIHSALDTKFSSYIHQLSDEIIRNQQKSGDKQYWVFIDSADTSERRIFAKKLAKALKSNQKNVVLFDEAQYKYKQGVDRYRLQKDMDKISAGDNIDIIIYTGEYIYNVSMYYNGNARRIPALLSKPSLKIYLYVEKQPSTSSPAKKKNKRKKVDIRRVKEEAYEKYIFLYDPATYSDYVFAMNPHRPRELKIITPVTKLRLEKIPGQESKNEVVIFGAGAVGCGLFGLDFKKSGYKVSFIDTDERLVAKLDSKKEYIIKNQRKPSSKNDKNYRAGADVYVVDNISATLLSNEDKVRGLLSNADTVCLAVPDSEIAGICSVLGKFLNKRAATEENVRPFNIFLATNMIGAADYVRGQILDKIDGRYRNSVRVRLGIIETDIRGTMRLGLENEEEKLGVTTVYSEPDTAFAVGKDAFRGNIPHIEGMQLSENIAKEREIRTCLRNCPRAFIAYLGYLKGYKYMHEAWKDPWIETEINRLLRLLVVALAKKYKVSSTSIDWNIEQLIDTVSNLAMEDPVVRVTRDPLRKLGPAERFMTAARLLESIGAENEIGHIALGVAACLLYNNSEDRQAVELQARIAKEGLGPVLKDICKVDPQSRFSMLILEKYEELKKFGVAYGELNLVNPVSSKDIKAVVINLDGVIINTTPVSRECFASIYWKILNGIGDYDPKQPLESELAEGRAYFDNEILGRCYVSDKIPDIIDMAVKKGVKPADLKPAEEYISEYIITRNAEVGRILEADRTRLLDPRALKFLNYLNKQMNKRVYFLSSMRRQELEYILKHLGLSKLLPSVIFTGGVTNKIGVMKDLIDKNGLKTSNLAFIDNNTHMIELARKELGGGLTIVAFRREVVPKENFASANFIFDYIPAPEEISDVMTPQVRVFSGNIIIPQQTMPKAEDFNRQYQISEQIDSAA